VRHLATTNLRLLHRRIVERSAATGSHYIAHSRAAYRAIWLRAAGGGLVTVMTAAVKTAIGVLHHAVHLAPLPLGLLYGINYAASFICLQHAGLILATKQPAMTAAALSTEVAASRDGGIDHARIVAVTMRIVQSQFAAAVANVAMVSLGAVAFDALWHLGTGRHWLRPEDALSIYNDLSPIDSLTVFYAALTGVILWLSSLIGGWADNWSARNRIHLGIAELRLGGRIGRPRMARWGEAWRIHIAGWATNISLGMMLGMTPALGYVLGLPLDVRHVTLNSGILSLACVGLEGGWWRDGFFLLALWGVAVMFVLNLGVSFGLSLYTALRAYELGPGELRRILGAIVRHALRHPLDLVLPRGLPAHAPH
jgi:site-specific recombinase